MSNQLQAGETFTDNPPGNAVNAAVLNNHVNGATLLKAAVDGQPEKTSMAETDYALIADESDNVTTTPKKVSGLNLLPETVRNCSKQYAAGTLSGGVYAVTLSPAATQYTQGMVVFFLPDTTNSGAVKIDVNGLGQKNIYKGGTTGPVALVANDIVVNVLCVVQYDGTQFQLIGGISLSNQVTSITGQVASLAAINASLRGLLITRPTTTTLAIVAAEVLMEDNSGQYKPFVARSVSLTADITASGVNGLDTGTAAASNWYYLWLIYNGTTQTTSCLLSLSGTSPTLPANYTYAALLGAAYYNGSSQFNNFTQQDRQVWIAELNLFTAKTSAAANTYEAYSAGAGGSDVNLATLVPPIARRLFGVAGSTSGNHSDMAIAADTNGTGAVTVVGASAASSFNSFGTAGGFQIPLLTAQTFYWKSVDNSTARTRIDITGYSL